MSDEDNKHSTDELADIKSLQKHLVDTFKIGFKSAKACAEQFVASYVDSVVAFEALTLDNATAILAKDPSIPSVSRDLILKHFSDKKSEKDKKVESKSNTTKDQSALQKYLSETVGLGSSSAKQVADVLSKNNVDSVSLLTSIEKEKLEKILVQPEVSKVTEDMVLKALYPEKVTAVEVVPSKEAITAIEKYLKTTIGLGNQSSATCALYFVKAKIDCIPLLTSLVESEINKILDHPDVASATKILIVDTLKSLPQTSGQMSDEEKAAMVQKATDDVQKILDEVSNASDLTLKENKARLDSAVNSLNAAAAKANWKTSVASKDSVLGEINTKKTEGNKSITTGNYATYQEMANGMSEGALRKGVMFVNGPGFGSRAACPLFDYVESAKKFKDMQMMNTPKIDFNEITCYTSEAQSSFEAMQKSGMSSDSFSVKAAGFYNGVAGAMSVQGTFTSDSKSDSQSTSKRSSYTSYKTTSTFVSINSFQINLSKVCLDAMAIQDFKNVTNEGLADQFLTNYGTHVLLTPQTTGGIYNSTCTITFTSQVSQEERTSAVSNAKTIRGGVAVVAPFGGGSAGYEHRDSSTEGNKSISNSKNENYYYEYNVDTMGPQVLEFSDFHTILAANNKTHCLVSNGFSLGDPATWAMIPVWEVALQAPELKNPQKPNEMDEVARLLRDAWLKKVLLTSGAQLEAFMSMLVKRALRTSLPTDKSNPNWADAWHLKLDKKILSDEPDPSFAPVNVWCILVSENGLAVDVPDGDFSIGKEIWAQRRNNGITQIWRLTPEGYIQNTRGYVLTVQDNTSRIVLQLPNNNNAQKFFFHELSRQLMSHTNTANVLAVKSSTAGSGLTLESRSYDVSNQNQKFRWYPVEIPPDMVNKVVPDSIINKWCYIYTDRDYTRVLDVTHAETKDGAKVNCCGLNGGSNQIWRLTNNGILESKSKSNFALFYENDTAVYMKSGATETVQGNGNSCGFVWTYNNDRQIASQKDTSKCLKEREYTIKTLTVSDIILETISTGVREQKWRFVPVDF